MRKKRKKHTKLKRAALIALAVVVVLVGGVAAYGAWYTSSLASNMALDAQEQSELSSVLAPPIPRWSRSTCCWWARTTGRRTGSAPTPRARAHRSGGPRHHHGVGSARHAVRVQRQGREDQPDVRRERGGWRRYGGAGPHRREDLRLRGNRVRRVGRVRGFDRRHLRGRALHHRLPGVHAGSAPVHIEAGNQLLNGEQCVALARMRTAYGDDRRPFASRTCVRWPWRS